MNVLFNSCHACTTAANIVVSFIDKDTYLPVNYLPTDLTSVGVNTNTVYNLECLAKGSTFGGQTVTIAADNCAKAVGRIIGAATFHCV